MITAKEIIEALVQEYETRPRDALGGLGREIVRGLSNAALVEDRLAGRGNIFGSSPLQGPARSYFLSQRDLSLSGLVPDFIEIDAALVRTITLCTADRHGCYTAITPAQDEEKPTLVELPGYSVELPLPIGATVAEVE